MKSYNLEKKDIKELIKLYPKIKVPFFDYYNYYLSLQDNNDYITNLIIQLKSCKEIDNSIEHYKMKKFDEIIKYFKEDTSYLKDFNDLELNMYQTNLPKSFGNWDSHKVYLSIDLKEANWSILKKSISLKETNWVEFIINKFDLNPFIANSKSFRQFIFGNLNPGRQQHFQKEYMIELSKILPLPENSKIVMLSPDEILIEFNSINDYIKRNNYLEDTITETELKLNLKVFTIDKVENFGDNILIKKPLYHTSTKEWELYAVPGNRFFIHYKILILNKKLEEPDLLFEPEPKKLAKWILY